MAHISTTYVPAEDAPTLRTPIDAPAFRDSDDVIFIGGTMRGLTGKVVDTDSRPGETAVFVAAWGIISYAIPESHLHRL